MKPLRTADELVHLNVKVPEFVLARLEEAARRDHVRLQALVAQLLQQALESESERSVPHAA